MTNEEKEFEELALLEEFEAEEASRQSEVEQNPGMLESFGKGAIEGVPFAKDIIAAGETLYESGFDNFSENFDKNQAEWNEAINIAESKNPASFFAGDVLGGVATTIAAPGLGATAKGAALYGAVSAVSRSENRDIQDVLKDPSDIIEESLAGAALGTVGYGVGKVIGKGVNKIKESLGFLSKAGAAEAAGAVTSRNKKILNEHISKHYMKDPKVSVRDAVSAFADEIDELGLIKVGQSPEAIGKSAEYAGKKLALAKSQILESVNETIDGEQLFNNFIRQENYGGRSMVELLGDDSIDKTTKAQIKQAMAKIKNNLLDVPKRVKVGTKEIISPDPETGGQIKQVIDVFDDVDVFKKFKAKDLDKLRASIAKRLGQNKLAVKKGTLPPNPVDEFEKRIVGFYSDTVSDVVDKSADTAINKEAFKKLNRQISNTLVVQDMTDDLISKRINGPMEILHDAIKSRGIWSGALVGVTSASKKAALMTTLAINRVLTSPTVPSNMAAGLKRLSEHVATNPESPLIKRISVAAASSSDDFRKAIKSSISEISLIESAVARETDQVYARQDEILGALDFHAPEQAAVLRELIDNNDDDAIAGFMDQMSKHPKMKRYFESGTGFNGRVFSDEDKAFYRNEIQSSDASLAQKLLLLKDLDKTGTIPQIDPTDNKQRKQYIPRNKNKLRL